MSKTNLQNTLQEKNINETQKGDSGMQKENSVVNQSSVTNVDGVDIEKLFSNPAFVEMFSTKVREESQKLNNQFIAMQSINDGKFYGKLNSFYTYKGKQKMKKDDSGNAVPLLDKDGKEQFYDDKHYFTFGNEKFGEKQLEVKSIDIYNLYKESKGEPFIIFYELESNPFDARALNPVVTHMMTLNEYQSTLSA